jgi:hypothetical protein
MELILDPGGHNAQNHTHSHAHTCTYPIHTQRDTYIHRQQTHKYTYTHTYMHHTCTQTISGWQYELLSSMQF